MPQEQCEQEVVGNSCTGSNLVQFVEDRLSLGLGEDVCGEKPVGNYICNVVVAYGSYLRPECQL